MPIPLPSAGATVPAAGLLRDGAYDQLCSAIVDGTLAPGEQLRDAELTAWLGVSRTTVREALLRLGRTGLVLATPGRPTVVAEIDPYAVRDALEVVTAMHALAVRTAVPLLRPADLEVMRRANERFTSALAAGDAKAAMVADDQLHGVAVDVTANTALSAVLAQYLPVLRRIERQRFGSLTGRRSVALHEKLISACTRGDTAAAVRISDLTWSSLSLLLDLPGEKFPDGQGTGASASGEDEMREIGQLYPR